MGLSRRHIFPFVSLSGILPGLISILLSLAFLLLTSLQGNTTPILTLTFIDVGEGDAIYLENPGHCNFLIDTGNPKSGVKVLSTLVQMGISRIDHLILTHPHLDHMGGVFTVAQLLPVSRFYDNGEDLSLHSKTHDMARWYQDLVRKSPEYSILKAGQRIECPPLTVEALWPPRPSITKDWNTNSLVLMVSFGAFRCLLMADANLTTERELLKASAPLKAHILRVGHHGARDAASQAFLSAVSPEIAIISVDGGNIHGYPDPKTLRRIQESHARLFRTDRQGTITIQAHPDGTYRVFTERP